MLDNPAAVGRVHGQHDEDELRASELRLELATTQHAKELLESLQDKHVKLNGILERSGTHGLGIGGVAEPDGRLGVRNGHTCQRRVIHSACAGEGAMRCKCSPSFCKFLTNVVTKRWTFSSETRSKTATPQFLSASGFQKERFTTFHAPDFTG